MADTKISALTGATTPLDGTEVLPIVQSGTTKKVANNDLRPKQIQNNATSGVLQVANISAAATRVMTVPDADFSAARTDAAQSFTGVNTFVTAGTGTGAPIYVAPTSNALTDVYIGRNLSTGTSALTRFALGNNATPTGFTMALYGSNHSTRPNQVQINNEFGSSLSISANGGADNMVLASNGNLTLDTGNLVIGTSGKGIDFSATGQAAGMTSELLADYEEGTWTPSLTAQTPGDLSVSYTTQLGTYTKIGRNVTITFVIITSSFTHSTASGALQITTTPFTPQSAVAVSYQGTCTVGGVTKASYTNFNSRLSGGTSMTVIASGSGVTPSNIDITEATSGGTIRLYGQLTYEV